MRLRPIVWMALGIAVLGTASFLHSRGGVLKPVPLPPNSELRVLAVCVGERRHLSENRWRRLARTILERFDPVHGSGNSRLFLSVSEYDRSKQLFVLPKFANPTVRLPDGRMAAGRLMRLSNNIVQLEFPVFPRADREIAIELLRGREKVQFSINNPKPVRPAVWTAAPLPQTNESLHTRLILEKSGSSASPLRLKIQGLGRAQAQWTHWRAQLFDELGNWVEMDLAGMHVRPPLAPMTGDCLKLIARGTEYISAGMLALPKPGETRELSVPLRATELGLNQVFLLGEGEYRFSSGKIGVTTSTNRSTEDRLDFVAIDSMSIRCTKPSLLLFSTNSQTGNHLYARFRERGPEERKDKRFLARSFAATNHFSTQSIARLLSFNLTTQHAQLEAEIMFHHPPAEFFVAPQSFGE